MNILIDTHILIWAVTSPKNLKNKEKILLLSQNTIIHVSAVNLWEISLKHSLGKIELKNIQLKDIKEAIIDSGFKLINLEINEAHTFYKLPYVKNKDPFDRMLIWQSIFNDFHFLTRDSKISAYKDVGLKYL